VAQVVEALASEACRQAHAVEHGNEQLVESAVEVFRHAVLLRRRLDRVLAPNAVLGKERVSLRIDLLNCFSTMALNSLKPSNLSDFFLGRQIQK
jgi:hypothetical protein